MIFRFNIHDEIADTADIVGQNNAANSLNEDEAKSLSVVGGSDITEANCEHDVGTPVIGPDIFLVPLALVYLSFGHPVLGGADFCHCWEDYGQNMGKAEVKQHYFYKRPVFVIFWVCDEFYLYFLKGFQD